MRVGVRYATDRITAVYVRDDGSYGMHEVPGVSEESLETLLVLVAGCARTPSMAQPAATRSEAVRSITFDVSELLVAREDSPATLVRIAPRPPLDDVHELPVGQLGDNIEHIRGGHTTVGEAIFPLDTGALRSLAERTPRDSRLVISSVGSLVNPEHEAEAGRILLQHTDARSIEYSHSFFSSSFTVREKTAAVNSALVSTGQNIATMLGLTAGRAAPGARLFVATNDGGCVPLPRLSVTPIHSLLAGEPTELVGASALVGGETNSIVVAGRKRVFMGEILKGVPTIVPAYSSPADGGYATQMAQIVSLSEFLIGGRQDHFVVVASAGADEDHPLVDAATVRRSDVDLGALGAACAPLVDWANRIVMVGSAAEMEHALAAAQARVSARLVSFGELPSSVHILESRAIATTYDNPKVVSVRVRGIAGGLSTNLVGRASDAFES